jgi:flagellar protein FlbT
MALKVELKPNERILIGDCVITNSNVPILREKDILTVDRADTPAKRIYLAVQLMYIGGNPTDQHEVYFALMKDIVEAAPSAWTHVAQINNHILTGDLYKALKSAKKLIEYEQELLSHASCGQSLRSGSTTDRKSA